MRFIFALLAAAALSMFASAAQARSPAFGVRAGLYADADAPFLGAEVAIPFGQHAVFDPNFEIVFIDEGRAATGNLDFYYKFPVGRKIFLYPGLGMAVIYADPDGPGESDTDLGVNIFGGMGFRVRHVAPYVQIKLILGPDDYDELVVGAGMRF